MKKLIRFNVLLTIFAVSLIFIAAKSPTPRSEDIVFIPNPENCNSYYAVQLISHQVGCGPSCKPDCKTVHVSMVEGSRILLRCPSGFWYDPTKLYCEIAYKVSCKHFPPCSIL